MCDVLVIDSDREHAEIVVEKVRAMGSSAHWIAEPPAALRVFEEKKPRLVLLDSSTVREVSSVIARLSGDSEVVLMNSGGETETLLRWVSLGVRDILRKPIEVERVLEFLKKRRPKRALGIQCSVDTECVSGEMVVGECPGMVSAMKTAGLVARTGAPILIRGESGTGKELLAREIHRVSNRTGPFIPLNCAAVAEGVAESELFGHERGAFTGAIGRRAGCFEQANNGTLFLDEIGDSIPGFQAKLLRALDRGEFFRVGGETLVHANARIVAATHCDLERQIDEGAFRLDLFYRLGAVTLTLPPLRDRKEDLPMIVQMMLARLSNRLGKCIRGVTREGTEWLMNHNWPGNLRELQHVVHRAVLLCGGDVIHVEHLQAPVNGNCGEGRACVQTLAEVEQDHIQHILDVTGGNRGRACQLLGISRPTLRRKMARYDLRAGEPECEEVLS